MCPPLSPPNEISIYWSEEEIFTCLQLMSNGSPRPANVITDVNPWKYNPSNLPDGLWYLTTTEDTKCGKGFWKPKGEACEIFRNSSITGWRSTFEFYEGVAPDVLKTDWVMQQYKITQREQSKDIGPMVFSSLCRVFQGGGQGSDHETQKDLVGVTIAEGNNICSRPSVISNTDRSTGQGSKSESQVEHGNHETGPLAPSEGTLNQPDNLPEDLFSSADYLELWDLEEPISPSSSSDNSSCISQTSEDSDKDVGCRFSVAAPRIPDKVVLQPASSGTLTCDDRGKLPLERPPKIGSTKLPENKGLKCIGTQDSDNKVEGPSSNPRNLVALSGRNKAASSNGKEKAAAVKKKQQSKKCLCFLPF